MKKEEIIRKLEHIKTQLFQGQITPAYGKINELLIELMGELD